jgi:hypothetical protein
MTLPDERTRAVINTREFLLRLCSPYGGFKRIPGEVREEARRLLKHFPNTFDLLSPNDSFGPVSIPRKEYSHEEEEG